MKRNILALSAPDITACCNAHTAYLEPLLADIDLCQWPLAVIDMRVHDCTDMEPPGLLVQDAGAGHNLAPELIDGESLV